METGPTNDRAGTSNRTQAASEDEGRPPVPKIVHYYILNAQLLIINSSFESV